jgi:hypothetical protein
VILLEYMREPLDDQERQEYGVCPACGRRIALPCLACRVEALRQWHRAGHPASQDDLIEDLSIRLESPEEQRRYEEVRDFRDTHGYPMWSEQWYAQRKRLSRSCHDSC